MSFFVFYVISTILALIITKTYSTRLYDCGEKAYITRGMYWSFVMLSFVPFINDLIIFGGFVIFTHSLFLDKEDLLYDDFYLKFPDKFYERL